MRAQGQRRCGSRIPSLSSSNISNPASGFENVEMFTDEFRAEQSRATRSPVAILVQQRHEQAALDLLNDARAAGVISQFEQHVAKQDIWLGHRCAAFRDEQQTEGRGSLEERRVRLPKIHLRLVTCDSEKRAQDGVESFPEKLALPRTR
jgi:hypothetical protein